MSAAMVLGVTAPLGAVGPGTGVASGPTAPQQQRLFAWMFGGSSNPLLTDGFCGELVGKEFMLAAAIEAGEEPTCAVPFGVPVLASPGGCLDWFQVGTPDTDVTSQRDADCIGITDLTAELDGGAVNLTRAFASTNAYTIPVEA